MALIIGEVLCARPKDSFVNVNAWGAFRFSHAIDVLISCTWLQNDRIDLAGTGASAQCPNQSEIKSESSGLLANATPYSKNMMHEAVSSHLCSRYSTELTLKKKVLW